MANVRIIREVSNGKPKEWRLCFQWCEYNYEDGSPSEKGYRFIWRRDDDSLQAARGQARIPTLSDMNELIELAAYDGWLGSVENE